MKKLLALLLALLMVVSLAACSDSGGSSFGSSSKKEQEAADEWLEDYESATERYMEAAYDFDLDKMESIGLELEDLYDSYDGIYDDLYDKDPDAAQEFYEDYMELSNNFTSELDTYQSLLEYYS